MVHSNLKKPAFPSPALSLKLPLKMMPPEGFDPGSDNTDGGSGDDVDASDNSRRRKRYHRHTPQQIQELESLFKECPHPDEKRRLELSRRLNLETRQVKFWFQNRRTQMKTQLERHENSLLRQENDKLRAENMSIREAMRNPICSNCGGPSIIGEISVEQQHLKIENVRLKEEFDRVCAIANKFLGRSISLPSSSLELGFGSTEPTQTDKSLERSMLLELALVAMDELVKLAQTTEPVWGKTGGSMEILNRDDYRRRFIPCSGVKPAGFVSEASRETSVLVVNTSAFVETLMDANRWAEMFPSIIGRASTTEVISSGMGGTRNGSLQLMEAELQILSPLVPIREISFLRFCKQHAENVWAVVDVSIDGIREPSSSNCRRLPSGCVIEDNPDGYSKVTWVEHAEYSEFQIHPMYRPFVASGMGFGAQRWLATLQRQLERVAILASPTVDVNGLSGAGRRSMVKLAERMRESFCGGVCSSSVHKWNKLNAESVGEDVRVMTRSSVDNPGEPPGIILSAATSVWFPVSPLRLFDFLQDHPLRSQWDILSNGGPMKEIINISVGQAQSNSVSLLRASAVDTNKSSMLILQETCIDSSGFLVVYAPVDIPSIQLVMNGGDSAYVPLLPSGFCVVSDGRGSAHGDGGSLLTVAFQILVNSLPTAKLTVESVETVNNLLSCTVQKIKAALNCD